MLIAYLKTVVFFLLVAGIGFGMAWMLRTGRLREVEAEVEELLGEQANHGRLVTQLKSEADRRKVELDQQVRIAVEHATRLSEAETQVRTLEASAEKASKKIHALAEQITLRDELLARRDAEIAEMRTATTGSQERENPELPTLRAVVAEQQSRIATLEQQVEVAKLSEQNARREFEMVSRRYAVLEYTSRQQAATAEQQIKVLAEQLAGASHA